MGRATILSEHGEGKYRIKLEADKAAATIAAMTEQRARDLERRITLAGEVNKALFDALQARNAVLAALNAWLSPGIPYDQATKPARALSGIATEYLDTKRRTLNLPAYVTDAIRVREEKSAALAEKRRQFAELEATLEASKLKLESIQSVYETLQTPRDAWCADYTEGLTGVVATIEPPGDPDTQVHTENVNIAPGGAAPGSAYGALQLATALSPAGFAWNLAMLAPVIKWKPTWRYGTVLGKNEDGTLHIAFDAVDPSSGRWLGADRSVNDPWQDAKQRVAVQYMNCNAAAFEVGDEVVVEWREGQPVVIGFRHNPKTCFPCEITIRHAYTGATNPGGFAQILVTIELMRICGNSPDVTQQFYTSCSSLGGSPCGPMGSSSRLTYFEQPLYVDVWYGGSLPVKTLSARYGVGDDAVTQEYQEETGSLLYQVFRQKRS